MNKEQIEFLSDIDRELSRLELQRHRILTPPSSESNALISSVHDADFYVVLLRRLYRQVEKFASNDSRVANLKGKYRELVAKVKIRDHFEHGVDLDTLPPTDATQLPGLRFSVAAAIANVKIITSVFIDKKSAFIVSGNFKWDLYKDHKSFIDMINEMASLYPFVQNE